MATTLLKMFPDFDKTTKEMLAAVAAKLESLAPEMLRLVCNPVNGIASKQAYAPQVFHIEEFVKGIEEKKNKFLPTPSPYRKSVHVGEDGIGVEKPWESENYGVKMRGRKKRLDRKDERLKLGREKYGPKVWIDADGWLHTGGRAVE